MKLRRVSRFICLVFLLTASAGYPQQLNPIAQYGQIRTGSVSSQPIHLTSGACEADVQRKFSELQAEILDIFNTHFANIYEQNHRYIESNLSHLSTEVDPILGRTLGAQIELIGARPRNFLRDATSQRIDVNLMSSPLWHFTGGGVVGCISPAVLREGRCFDGNIESPQSAIKRQIKIEPSVVLITQQQNIRSIPSPQPHADGELNFMILTTASDLVVPHPSLTACTKNPEPASAVHLVFHDRLLTVLSSPEICSIYDLQTQEWTDLPNQYISDAGYFESFGISTADSPATRLTLLSYFQSLSFEPCDSTSSARHQPSVLGREP